MTTGFIYDPRFRDHDTGPYHPERAARLDATLDHLRQQPWFETLRTFSTLPVDITHLETTHTLDYIRRAQAACAANAPYLDTADVAISTASYATALLAAGAPLVLADALVAGSISNGFALLRPPGHHAERDMALGFCLFNNVAILARYLKQRHGLDKIAILDWDVHHGNGTQHTFEQDPSVLYISVHQYPYYPGTGAASETGVGRGAGATLNIPVPAGAHDARYERAFAEQIMPALSAFKPECLIVSAGFDAHRDDPLADINLSTSMYGWMTARVQEVAEQYAGGRVLSVLEGGYHLQRLGECVATHLGVLCGAAQG